ncbi:helix-turn-helix domain-containing protein [Lentilactobacillus raoultii]|uniref:Helix-turn-helix domain-containing protein n=1 Tax=Lentilactobacillus raoultii TaxID=1987503 RepID=A0ABW3PJI7_9LACO|nr:helix-turn-helix domain-containing protein [Lentilactobacillus raoultii]
MSELPQLLKAKRLELGLSQKDMAAGVISPSFYSKVENGIHDLNTIELIKILKMHSIPVVDFVAQIAKDIHPSKSALDFEALRTELYTAFFDANTKAVGAILTRLKKESQKGDRIQYLETLGKLILVILTDKVNELSDTEKQQIRCQIFKSDGWTKTSLSLFSDAMDLFGFDELAVLIHSVLKQARSKKSPDMGYQRIMASIMVNFADRCYRDHMTEPARAPLAYTCDLPPLPELMFYKLLGKYFLVLFHLPTATQIDPAIITAALKEADMQQILSRLPKIPSPPSRSTHLSNPK